MQGQNPFTLPLPTGLKQRRGISLPEHIIHSSVWLAICDEQFTQTGLMPSGRRAQASQQITFCFERSRMPHHNQHYPQVFTTLWVHTSTCRHMPSLLRHIQQACTSWLHSLKRHKTPNSKSGAVAQQQGCNGPCVFRLAFLDSVLESANPQFCNH